MAAHLFSFQPQWKEELVVRAEAGSFVLGLAMGISTAYLPDEAEWERQAPDWARSLWPQLRDELEEWCRGNGTRFSISPTGYVCPYSDDIPIVRANMEGLPFSRSVSVGFMLLCTIIQIAVVLLDSHPGSTFGSFLILGWILVGAGWLLLIRYELFPTKP